MEPQNGRIPLIRENRNYRTRTFKIFGGIQIGLGVLCGLLSIAGITIDGINVNKYCYPNYSYDYYYYRDCAVEFDASLLLAFDIICLIFSGWFILTGAFPFCMTEKRINSWRCLKITFMVLCILGASIFIPTVFSLGIVGAIIRANDSGALAAVPGIQALIALTELVVAIVAASYSCCCSTWKTTNSPGLVIVSGNHPRDLMSLPTTTPFSVYNPQHGNYNYGTVDEQQQTQNTSRTQPPPYKQ